MVKISSFFTFWRLRGVVDAHDRRETEDLGCHFSEGLTGAFI